MCFEESTGAWWVSDPSHPPEKHLLEAGQPTPKRNEGGEGVSSAVQVRDALLAGLQTGKWTPTLCLATHMEGVGMGVVERDWFISRTHRGRAGIAMASQGLAENGRRRVQAGSVEQLNEQHVCVCFTSEVGVENGNVGRQDGTTAVNRLHYCPHN